MRKKKLLTILLCVLVACVGVLSGLAVVLFRQENRKIEKEEDGRVDFERLQKINPDIYAWITIPGTEIDCPVLQKAEDNAWYISHAADGRENLNGAIYTEAYNHKDFQDPITVLYGQNCEDGSMFGSLKEYSDRLFMKEHQDIYITTSDKTLHYRIFAAYQTDNRHLLERFQNGETEGNRKAYLESILNNRTMQAQIDRGASVDADSRILTLSTHDDAGEQYRYLVQAFLVVDEG